MTEPDLRVILPPAEELRQAIDELDAMAETWTAAEGLNRMLNTSAQENARIELEKIRALQRVADALDTYSIDCTWNTYRQRTTRGYFF